MIWRMRAESWEWINPEWWPSENQTEKTPELLRMGEKNSPNQKQLWEDGIKLELRIFGRTGKNLRGTLLRSSNVENDEEKHHHELFRHSGKIKSEKVEPTMKRIWKILEKDIWVMTNHSYIKLGKNLRVTLGRLEESGKILGKDLWVRAHSKETSLNGYLKGRLHRLN